ncbi:major facilitator superfamily domain-containing protein [Hysterangium stoloniferum]|nr:major facilitator superfamily domain-containing protein [Hysterangium stoloniferum]
MSERTPLLSEQRNSRPRDIYDRFTDVEKRSITIVISIAGIIGPFAMGSFLPCVPEIATDLNTTGAVINYTIAIYNLVLAVGNLIWAPYAGFYGRQPVYLACLPLIFIGGIVTAAARNVSELVIGRGIQGFGASCVIAIGAATISDIYRPEERGRGMGIFLGACTTFNTQITLLGPPLAPMLGGWLATYASWRVMQLCIATIGLVSFLLVAVFLPETIHPSNKGSEKSHLAESLGISPTKTSWKFMLNPFKILLLLKNPVLCLLCLSGSLAITAFFVAMVPLSYTLGPRYGMNTPALIGVCFLPTGLGSIAGAIASGRLADMAVVRGRDRRQGKWNPEDRLLAAIPGALFIIPCALITFALSVVFIPGKVGLTISLIALFFNGMGVDMVVASTSTCLVDMFRSQSAEVMAVANAMKMVFSAVVSAVVLPMVYQYGIVATNMMTILLVWLACILLYVTIKNGERLRCWADKDYTSVGDN